MRPSALRQLQRIYEASNGKACELGLPAACQMSIVERLTPANEVLDGSAEDLDAGRNVGWGTDAQVEVLPSTRTAPLWWDETDLAGRWVDSRVCKTIGMCMCAGSVRSVFVEWSMPGVPKTTVESQ